MNKHLEPVHHRITNEIVRDEETIRANEARSVSIRQTNDFLRDRIKANQQALIVLMGVE